MGTPVCAFNGKGLNAFRNYLRSLAEDPALQPPFEYLDDATLCSRLAGDISIDRMLFPRRLEMAQYLAEGLSSVQTSLIEQNVGLWSWLSLFYFDQVCPPDAKGARTPGREYRHILDKSYRYRHRHLLAGPYQAYTLYGDQAMLFLCSPLYKENTFHHELVGRQIFMSNPSIIEASHRLYWDTDNGKPKAGSQTGGKPGNLRRFVTVVQQIDMTYDLYSTSADEILALLPQEFDGWKG